MADSMYQARPYSRMIPIPYWTPFVPDLRTLPAWDSLEYAEHYRYIGQVQSLTLKYIAGMVSLRPAPYTELFVQYENEGQGINIPEALEYIDNTMPAGYHPVYRRRYVQLPEEG